MADKKQGEVLATLFDGGAFTGLFAREGAGVEAAYGQVGGQGAYAVCQKGEALSAKDVDTCRKVLQLASKTGNPVVTFYNSGGALLEEGLAALTAAGRLNAAAAKLSGVVPQLAVVTGNCGASASLAAVAADVLIMCEDASLYLTPPFLSAAAGDNVEGAGSAKAAKQAGVAALVAKDAGAAAAAAAKLLAMLPANNLSAAASFEYEAPAVALKAGASGIQAAEALADADSFVELYKGFGGGVVVGLATVAGQVTGFVATNGPDSFLGRYCVAKTARFMRFCDAFSIPVATILNTGGFAQSSTSDETGNLREAARLTATYADATTAKVTLITGKAVGPVYTALGGADVTIAVPGAVVAPAEPSAVVSVLYKEQIEASGQPIEAETAARTKAYEARQAGAEALLNEGLADLVAAPAAVRGQLEAALEMLATKRTQRLPKKHGNMAL